MTDGIAQAPTSLATDPTDTGTGRIVDVCAVADLPDGEVAVVTVEPVGRIAVFFTEGEYFGIADRCSHQQAWLSDGFVEGCAIECPLHASQFDLRTGRPDAPPAKVAVPVYRAFRDGDLIKVELPLPTGR